MQIISMVLIATGCGGPAKVSQTESPAVLKEKYLPLQKKVIMVGEIHRLQSGIKDLKKCREEEFKVKPHETEKIAEISEDSLREKIERLRAHKKNNCESPSVL